MNNETALMHRIMEALSQAGCLVWRSNTGNAWQGKTIHQQPGIVTLADPRMIRFGLCEGASDIVGIASVVITPDMVGKTVGVFTATEVKTERGRATTEQQRFINAVVNAGGIAGVVRSVDEALALIGEKP